jgi:hypothetical protein
LVIKQAYQATTIIAMAPPPQTQNSVYVQMLQASADAQLVPTLATAQVAARGLPGIDPRTLAADTASTASIEGELLFVNVRWSNEPVAETLSNAVAHAFIAQERNRLSQRYAIIHQGIAAKEAYLTGLLRAASGNGDAATWLRSTYANALSNLYGQDADARIQAVSQERGLQVVQPAATATAVGPKASLNAALGALLGLLIALIFAYMATGEFGESEGVATVRPVLSKVGD